MFVQTQKPVDVLKASEFFKKLNFSLQEGVEVVKFGTIIQEDNSFCTPQEIPEGLMKRGLELYGDKPSSIEIRKYYPDTILSPEVDHPYYDDRVIVLICAFEFQSRQKSLVFRFQIEGQIKWVNNGEIVVINGQQPYCFLPPQVPCCLVFFRKTRTGIGVKLRKSAYYERQQQQQQQQQPDPKLIIPGRDADWGFWRDMIK
jgi:hypothetical protein